MNTSTSSSNNTVCDTPRSFKAAKLTALDSLCMTHGIDLDPMGDYGSVWSFKAAQPWQGKARVVALLQRGIEYAKKGMAEAAEMAFTLATEV